MARLLPVAVVAAIPCMGTGHAATGLSDLMPAALPQPSGVVGIDGRQNVRDLPRSSQIRRLASPVGKLIFTKRDGSRTSCTGFILSHKYVATNYHCAFDDDGTPLRADRIVMGYLGGGESGTQTKLLPNAVEASGDLDYAILEFAKWTTTVPVYGTVSLSDAVPGTGDDLILIGHPKGRPLQVSQEGCRVTDEDRYRGAMAHTCDSEPGSSGSPVFDAKTGKVVAINFGGYRDGSGPNVATPIAAIAPASSIIRSMLSKAAGSVEPDDPKTGRPQVAHGLKDVVALGTSLFVLSLMVFFWRWFMRRNARRSRQPTRDRPHTVRARKNGRSTAGSASPLSRFFDAVATRRTRRRPRSLALRR